MDSLPDTIDSKRSSLARRAAYVTGFPKSGSPHVRIPLCYNVYAYKLAPKPIIQLFVKQKGRTRTRPRANDGFSRDGHE